MTGVAASAAFPVSLKRQSSRSRLVRASARGISRSSGRPGVHNGLRLFLVPGRLPPGLIQARADSALSRALILVNEGVAGRDKLAAGLHATCGVADGCATGLHRRDIPCSDHDLLRHRRELGEGLPFADCLGGFELGRRSAGLCPVLRAAGDRETGEKHGRDATAARKSHFNQPELNLVPSVQHSCLELKPRPAMIRRSAGPPGRTVTGRRQRQRSLDIPRHRVPSLGA
jgi:hypothetical protein